MTTEKLSPKQQADQLLSKLLKGKEVYEIFSNTMRKQLMVSGHTLEYWENKFKIKINTDNLTPAICIGLDVQLMNLSQEASFYHAAAQAKAQMLKRGSEASYNGKFWSLVEEHKAKGGRLPSATTLETLAKVDNEDIDSAETIAQIELKFWKEIIEYLNMCRKLVENAVISLSVELKFANTSNIMEKTVNKYNGK